MFKHLFVGLGLFLSVSGAGADEVKERDSDVFFKLGGGARLRQYNMEHGSAGGLPGSVEDFSHTIHRLQLDVRLDKGEYFQTYFRLINAKNWRLDEYNDDKLFVQQAYGNWRVSDFLDLRFGRMPLELGRGLVYGLNEWENIPTFYDGAAALFDWSVLNISLYALRFYDMNRGLGSGNNLTEPRNTHYIVDLNFKDLSDAISMAELSFLQVVGDEGTNPVTGLLQPQQRVQRYTFDLVSTGVYYEVGGTLSYLSGTESRPAGENQVEQYMVDVVAKWLMPDWNRFQFWVGTHYDTGEDDAGDNTNTQYESLNYNLHLNGGRLDLFRFGNLSYLRTGMSMHMLSDWYIGLEYFLFEKTKVDGANYFARSPLQQQILDGSLRLGPDKALGHELDLWVGKTFQSGVNFEVSVNYFRPGAALEQAFDTNTGSLRGMDKSIYNLIVDIGVFF